MLKEIKICLSENASHGRNLIVHATFHKTWRELREVPAQKIDLSDELSPLRPEHASKEARWTPQDIQDSDDITPLALHPEEKVRTPEKRMLHR